VLLHMKLEMETHFNDPIIFSREITKILNISSPIKKINRCLPIIVLFIYFQHFLIYNFFPMLILTKYIITNNTFFICMKTSVFENVLHSVLVWSINQFQKTMVKIKMFNCSLLMYTLVYIKSVRCRSISLVG